MTEMLHGKTILITGLTGPWGFVGRRLIQKLARDHKVTVRVLLRHAWDTAGIAHLPLDLRAGSLTDARTVDRAVAGCDVVFHTVYDDQDLNRNFRVVQVLAEACLHHRVRRLVDVGSAASYEPFPDGILDESFTPVCRGWPVPANKRALDRRLLYYARRSGLPVVVMQPTIVYGPYSDIWTILVVRKLQTGWIVLPDPGEGLCNAVYVDDVVSALIRAATADGIEGERILVSGSAPITWRRFYAAFEEVVGLQRVVLMTAEEILRLLQVNGTASRLAQLRREPLQILKWRPVRDVYAFARSHISEVFWRKVREKLPLQRYLPDEKTLALYQAKVNVSIEKARRLLGYEPQFSFERGMALTAEYIIKRAKL